jgi:endogenous inhibitor of DNA gyrase (YacG/DUF329 family)
MTSAAPQRRVSCPTCKALAVYDASNRWRPFCSQRCRSADLGAWASEQFRVADTAPADDDEQAGRPLPS